MESNKKSCIQELHKHKAATPTMGGIAMNLSLILLTLLYYLVTGTFLWVHLLLILYGVMGFIDDYIKIKKLRDGVTRKEKLIGLTLISVVVVSLLLAEFPQQGQILFPFVHHALAVNGYLYGALMVFLIVMSSNSVNITDGLDGLALGVCSIVYGFIAVFAYRMNADDVLFGAVVMLGACLATLWFNKYPAKIFMGDTGSLMLGGSIAVFLIRLEMPVWIVLMLIVSIFEAVSVIIQLSSLRFFHKRVFKIAPFHHHLEKCGWRETVITSSFCMVTLGACILAYLGFGVVQ
ncbi:phospho-N-acetylmuramoyl-pentapeptide-transferase [Gorillibacterium massiliense]|uniref:phospho-N-acetylmuramoyl-pentapeptide- transferase n=1 Tax=Gorillibacterium massiliense TaxID=1280390 RepID=UPI0012DEA526|nr:phospho-N-acetylmuramoyl-pentapeptide-transferase [Gorillibacterium massiliense]